ncbi:MAG TPA: sulfatase [Chitinophagaceae bacterium]
MNKRKINVGIYNGIAMFAVVACTITLIGLISFKPAPKATSVTKKYNVLFIATDDCNNDLSIYGHKEMSTPNIERLAKRGIKFDRAYCQFPLCNPSRTSILTGLTPDETKIYDLQTSIRQTIPDAVTIPQLFKQNGYYSARVGKIFHYGVPNDIGTNGLDDSLSWEQRINPIGRDKTEQNKVINFTPSRGLGSALSYLSAEGTDEEQTDGKVATEAIKLMKENKDKPFFLAVGFFRPHTPYVAPKKYFDLYPTDKINLPNEPANDLDDIPEAAFFTKPANWGLSETQLKEAIRGYHAAISFMDAQVGRLLDGLDELKLSDNTIIVLWSDHGYNLGQHGQWMKQSLFENSAKVPLIISVPGGINGKASERIVELLDLYPTLADLCNLKLTQKVSGVSLTALLKNPGAAWDRPGLTQVSRGKIMGRSIRTERWRYTEWDQGKAGVELYDEQNDKGEITNLATDPQFASIVKELSVLLRKGHNAVNANSK